MYFSYFKFASVAALVAFTSAARGDDSMPLRSTIDNTYHLSDAESLIAFANMVNEKGLVDSETKVYLDDDIEFTDELSKQFVPIGKGYYDYFKGHFDGQGYRISNLTINGSDATFVGLFGKSQASEIKNIVMDSSCTVIANDTYYGSEVGGIIGSTRCHSGGCVLDNLINMAEINIFLKNEFYAGGIVGRAYSQQSDIIIRNCANFGSIVMSDITRVGQVGGIVGRSDYYNKNMCTIANCINYGDIRGSLISEESYMGGICGVAELAKIENCVNMGAIEFNSNSAVDHIAGRMWKGSIIKNSYWLAVDNDSHYGKYRNVTVFTDCASFNDTDFELDTEITVGSYTGTSLVGALSAYSGQLLYSQELSKWLLNKNSATVTFNYFGRMASVELDSPLILTPKIPNFDFMVFKGWFSDAGCTEPFNSIEVTEDIDLYGKMEENYKEYTVTFDSRGGTPIKPVTAKYKTVLVTYTPERDGFIFMGWENELGEAVTDTLAVPPYNVTLYASWLRTHIETPEELIEVANVVNSGKTLDKRITIYLTKDIDFTEELSKQFEAIGDFNTEDAYFKGVFDGQGYTIRNLNFDKKNPGQYLGLIGYARSSTVKNVVLDSTCAYTVAYPDPVGSNYMSLGGIVGYVPSFSTLRIEGCINMAKISVTAAEDSNIKSFDIGGIVAASMEWSDLYVNNCVNYGDISFSCLYASFYVGGITGFSGAGNGIVFANNINYGSISQLPLQSYQTFVGGIIGYAKTDYTSSVKNCVSVGKIDEDARYRGAFIGFLAMYCDITVENCIWTKETGTNYFFGDDNRTVANSSMVDINEETVDKLNNYSKKYGLGTWAYNEYKGSVKFIPNDREGNGWTFNGKNIVMLPKLSDTVERPFSGWFSDPNYNNPFTSGVVSAPSMTLYSKWCDTAVIFDAGNAVVYPKYKGVTYGKLYGDLPEPEKKGSEFIGWKLGKNYVSNETTVATSETHSLEAVFHPYKYVLTFDCKNGRKIVYVLEYDDKIEYPTDVQKDGYVLVEWNSTIKRMPDHDVVISAVWKRVGLSTLEIIFIAVPLGIIAIATIIIIVIVTDINKKKKKYAAFNDDDIKMDSDIKTEAADNGEPGVVVSANDTEPALNSDASVPLATVTISADDLI